MKKYFLIAMLAAAIVPAMAQNQGGHNCNGCPHHQQHSACSGQQGCGQKQNCNADGIALEVAAMFPTAKSVKKESKRTVVMDAKKNVLGYAVYSYPKSKGIKGYGGETPLMVALSPRERVVGVVLLDNNETPAYMKKVAQSGLLKSWDGMKLRRARRNQPDAVSGATLSSNSIIRSFQAAIKDL